MSAVTPQLLTAEEFWALPDSGRPRALVRGEVVETMPPGGVHGVIAINLGGLLRAWAKAGGRGVVGAEAGFILDRNPDVVRGPDLSFVAAARVPATGIPEAFCMLHWELLCDPDVKQLYLIILGITYADVRQFYSLFGSYQSFPQSWLNKSE